LCHEVLVYFHLNRAFLWLLMLLLGLVFDSFEVFVREGNLPILGVQFVDLKKIT
jgi:hypothetical protein